MNLRRVQLLFGHHSLNMTQVYLQFKDQDLREIYTEIALKQSIKTEIQTLRVAIRSADSPFIFVHDKLTYLVVTKGTMTHHYGNIASANSPKPLYITYPKI